MITNSSIYNEKHALSYELDTYKDILDEQYEILNHTKRQLKEKCKVIFICHSIYKSDIFCFQ